MMKKTHLVFFLFFFLSCENTTSNNHKKPDKLISKEKMSLIITDLMLSESYFQIKYSILPRYKEALLITSDSIFSNYQISSAQFDESYSYYLNQKEDLLDIYKVTLDSLNLKHSQVSLKK
tara:strand:- start:261 stop:620 length:360 start_codon:yes stop_codon:yes gene_type:complete